MCFVQSLKQQQGGNDSFGVHCPTKTAPLECDIKRGRSLDVPATWQPGQAKNLASRVISQLSEFALLVSSLTFRLPRPNHRRHPDLPRKCEWWCQPILRVCVCVCGVCVWVYRSLGFAHHIGRSGTLSCDVMCKPPPGCSPLTRKDRIWWILTNTRNMMLSHRNGYRKQQPRHKWKCQVARAS